MADSVNGEERLNQILEAFPEKQINTKGNGDRAEAPTQASSSIAIGMDFCQWSAGPNETYRPSGPRREKLPSGIYMVDSDPLGPFFVKTRMVTDALISLDDAATTHVLTSIRKFWKSRTAYQKRGVLYKRGLLLWGPAGSGKTATLALLMQELLRMDGLVFFCQNPNLLSGMLALLRRIEPERNLITVLEDIDELVARYGEHDLLALLDGETQIDNVVNIATTNYPERLGARIINRPSRFDERIFIDMPNKMAREKYLRHITRDESISNHELLEWVERTEGFSIAHLRELALAVFCLEQPAESVLDRLSKMQYQPRAMKEFLRPSPGFTPREELSGVDRATSACMPSGA